MGKLRQKIMRGGAGLGLLGALGFGGCAEGGYKTGLGAIMSGSDDPLTRATGTILYYKGLHEDKIEEQKAGRTQINIYNNRGRQEVNNYPLFFARGEKRKRIKGVFETGEPFFIYANVGDIIPEGTSLAVRITHLGTGKNMVKRFSPGVKRGAIIGLRMNPHDVGGTYRVIWYANRNREWEIIGNMDYTILDKRLYRSR